MAVTKALPAETVIPARVDRTMSSTGDGVPARIARFEIVKVLGEGAQGHVYLARDPRLGRPVAIKTLNLAQVPGPGELVRTLLEEARLVSQLQHPNIVTLYDADEEAGTPYLVFEFIDGAALAARIREAGRLPVAQAVEITIAVLAGIGYAHQKGVVHRDLKPANILINGNNVPRVTDFGIACRVDHASGAEGALFGTPRYMAPEYVSGQKNSPQTDVYAVGAILHEMLTGKPAFHGAGMTELLHRVLHVAPQPPSALNSDVDDRLDDIVLKALAKKPEERYADAAAMAQALARYLDPEPLEGCVVTDAKSGTIDFLVRRMRHKSDFPALSETIRTINKTLESENQRIDALCNSVLKDVALTSKLIKLVNSARFGQFGGSVSTVSRAVSIVGFDGVRSVAMSLILLERLGNKAQAAALREEIAAAYFGSIVAREVAGTLGLRNPEEASICAMFQGLGRILVAFYLHEEAAEIRRRVATRNMPESAAALEILGVSYSDLGLAVARHWNFPDRILKGMEPLSEPPRDEPKSEPERLRMAAAFASEFGQVLREGSADPEANIAGLSRRYGRCLGFDQERLSRLARESSEKFVKEAHLLSLPPLSGPLLGRLQAMKAERSPAQYADGSDPDVTVELPDTVLARTVINAPCPTELYSPDSAEPVNRQAVLTAGVQDITQALAGDYNLNDVLRIILETMYRGMGFARVLLLLRDPAENSLKARAGFGTGTEQLVARGFAIAHDKHQDVFFLATQQGADILIEDVDAPNIKAHIPAWYRAALDARGFVLFPIALSGKVLALIYADAMSCERMRFKAEELALLKTLRSQAVLAIRNHRI